MVDLTMLAPGPAGTTMLGESNIEAAARRGLAKQHDIASNDTKADNSDATIPAYKSSMGDKSQKTPHSLNDQSKRNGQALSQAEAKGSSSSKPSQVPISPKSELRGKWQRIRRRLHA
ncbi:uncharacterized protein N7477_006472 [Penicillium maclennaniae]|uniref:uncharacterized protein n=1 Tax=Penicillium maclennaniae TaxID=1343394 RepID=UPI002541F180|nr:uncharacterized protein N7477_006472 [Penicillium maclennaniae]KAJ5667902.1 hypothetical protein N7477_006472 [Penicillium maclennaniae]